MKLLRRSLAAFCIVGSLFTCPRFALLAAPRAHAQGEGAPAQADTGQDPAQSRSAAFQAVQGAPTQDVPGGPLLVYAYAFILVAVVAYVARLGRLQGKNRAELERLASVLERGRKD